MAADNRHIRVRIAPSPTGDWHLGNARTALFNYLFARRHGGEFFLRVEDTDQARVVPGAVERLLDLLAWLGLRPDPYDGQPYVRQSARIARYRAVAEELVGVGHAYYCFATPSELAAMRAVRQAAGLPPRYDNRWGYRDWPLAKAQARLARGDAAVIRQKMPAAPIRVEDVIHGAVTVDGARLDDHVLLKADGFPTYHLAHVVDDHDMNITHVIRGDEWLSSAPRHVALLNCLGWTPPVYAHVPVILDADKGKLSKRRGAKAVTDYRAAGYLPEAMINMLAHLGWSSGTDQEIFSLAELIELFDLSRVQASPAAFDAIRLDWFNAAHIRLLSPAALADRLLDYWQIRDPAQAERWRDKPDFFGAVVAVLGDRLVTLGEFGNLSAFFYVAPTNYLSALIPLKRQSRSEALAALELARATLAAVSPWTSSHLEAALREAILMSGQKSGEVLWPTRVALTGLAASPGVFEVLAVLGRDESLRRLETAVAKISSEDGDQPRDDLAG